MTIIREESNGNHWRSSDDSEADAVEEEPQYESLGEVTLLNLLGNFGDNGSVVHEEDNIGNRKRKRSQADDSLPYLHEAEAEAEVEELPDKRFGAPNTNLSL